ncbi:hypothetical protein [Thauera linaloolentis]|uniref:hypothetical protein n=1 Tax=Thauera linaloolentis TaxID=76112 RepID=UPI001FE03E44|nr:hypothetical protein [Thauera linaloolentis]MCM8567621.1 hypothetical protein [Thauera linaloolentis]
MFHPEVPGTSEHAERALSNPATTPALASCPLPAATCRSEENDNDNDSPFINPPYPNLRRS